MLIILYKNKSDVSKEFGLIGLCVSLIITVVSCPFVSQTEQPGMNAR